MGTEDQGIPLADSYDFWFLNYSKGKRPKDCLEHFHYFHVWSCSLPSKYKANFCRIPRNQRYKTLKQHQRFFLECIDLISDDVNVKVISIKCISFFSNEMDGWGSSLLSLKFLCMMMASNKSSNKTVMRERVLVIVLFNDVSLDLPYQP